MQLKPDNYQTAIENLHDAVIISECKGGNPVLFINDSFTELTGYTLEEVIEKPFYFLYQQHEEDALAIEVDTMTNCMKNRSSILLNLKAYKKDGTLFHVEVSLSQIKNERGRTTHYISIIRDTSIKTKLELDLFAENNKLYEEIQSLKLENKHDLVTGLLNRSAMKNEVKGLFLGAKRAEEFFTLMFVHLDNFKKLKENNDEHTLSAAIKQVAHILKDSLKRESDIVFRYSDNEFVVCFVGQDTQTSANFAKVLCEKVNTTALVGDKPLSCEENSVSIGVVSAVPKKNSDITDFMMTADIEMRAVAENKGNSYSVASPSS